jgi:hypothetical protein
MVHWGWNMLFLRNKQHYCYKYYILCIIIMKWFVQDNLSFLFKSSVCYLHRADDWVSESAWRLRGKIVCKRQGAMLLVMSKTWWITLSCMHFKLSRLQGWWLYVPCIVTVCTVYCDCMYRVLWLYVPCIVTVCTMYCDCMYRVLWLYVQCIVTVCTMYCDLRIVYCDCMYRVLWLYVPCIVTVCTVYCDCMCRVLWLYVPCIVTVCTVYCDCMYRVLWLYVPPSLMFQNFTFFIIFMCSIWL